MKDKKNSQMIPYNQLSPGWEGHYINNNDESEFNSTPYFKYDVDADGNPFMKYSLWGFEYLTEESWTKDILYINSMQSKLGELDKSTRRIRQHISSLLCCDSGIPVTIDEILNSIGTGQMPSYSFHMGCWPRSGERVTRPRQIESMKQIESILLGFLKGKSLKESCNQYPLAKGFIERCYKWLPPLSELNELQSLLFKRFFLPFDYLTRRDMNINTLLSKCLSEGGEGSIIDKKISKLAGLPKIYSIYAKEHQFNLANIEDDNKRIIYKISGNLASGMYEMSDCHHNTFRIIESWIFQIGTLSLDIPDRIKSTERERLGRLLFGYALGIDRWLQGIPQEFLLLDLSYKNLGFDIKNEILRVYAYLGNNNNPTAKWLVASLWFMLTYGHASLLSSFSHHEDLIKKANNEGLNVCTWMNTILHRDT